MNKHLNLDLGGALGQCTRKHTGSGQPGWVPQTFISSLQHTGMLPCSHSCQLDGNSPGAGVAVPSGAVAVKENDGQWPVIFMDI